MAVLDSAMGLGVRALGLAQVTTEAAAGAARGLAQLPRLIDVLERLAEQGTSLQRLVQSAPALDRLADGIRLIEQAAESEDVQAVRKAIESLIATTASLRPLADAVGELNRAVAQLNATVSPLQGTAERLGRLVDRLPARGRRDQPSTAIAPPFVAPTDT
jgi:uncharacterized coiled-coil protein SlyX